MPTQPTLVVVEGRNDISFLRIISSMLCASQSDVSDLAAMERQGRVLFLSCGGVCSPDMAQQLARLGCAQFHLLDRETLAEAASRQQVVTAIDALPFPTQRVIACLRDMYVMVWLCMYRGNNRLESDAASRWRSWPTCLWI